MFYTVILYVHNIVHKAVAWLEFVRIGDKVVSRQKIDQAIDEIINLRAQGMSQAEVSAKTGVDRTFISRLETLGEVRKGGSIAIIGFPISNCDEIRDLAKEEGVEFTLLMNDTERWDWVKRKSGTDLLNELLWIIAQVRTYEKVILIGSDRRLDLMRGLLDRGTDVFSIVIGKSPMTGDVQINPESLRQMIREIRG